MNEDICRCGAAINMVSKSLNAGFYGGYTQYESISKLITAHSNFYVASVEVVMDSIYISKIHLGKESI